MAGYVYVIESENHKVKIGKSINPEKRIISIKMTSGCEIVRTYVTPELHQYSALEAFLHSHFSKYRYIGEWFNVDYDIVTKYVSALNFSTWNIEPKPEKLAHSMEDIVRQLYYNGSKEETEGNSGEFELMGKIISKIGALSEVVHKKDHITEEYIENLYDQIDVLQSKLIYLQEQGVQVKFPKLPQYDEDAIILAREDIMEEYDSIE